MSETTELWPPPALDAAAMVAATAVAARCESLGRNCEFGVVQRRLGLEPIGLLRWAGTPLDALVGSVRRGFAGISQDMELWMAHEGSWFGRDLSTGIEFHCHGRKRQAEIEVRANEARRLPRLAEKLMEDLRDGEKILVFSSAEMSDPLDGLDLLYEIRRAGGFGPVLLVAKGAEQLPYPIEQKAWGAQLQGLTPMDNAASVDMAAWIRLLEALGRAIR